ncbi:MAG: nucleotidyltransferase domain-containing protein [Deltaproteobacteria bacterium]|nr:nucleotidyltransferase domain-containing protein [Deltaproteobacteria bacterium]
MNGKRAKIEGAHSVLDRIVDALVCAYSPQSIYLFGSRARGDAGSDSDYDLLVVLRKPIKKKLRRDVQLVLWRAGISAAADVVILTKETFEAKLTVKTSLPSIAASEGKLLYAA